VAKGWEFLQVEPRAVASNPGRLPVQFWVYFRCFPEEPVVLGVCLLIGLGLGILGQWIVLGAIGLGLVCSYRRILRFFRTISRHFWIGNRNPGVVVSHNPDLIAVLTDLSTGRGGYPVIKILPHPLKLMAGGRPAVGARVATIAIDHGLLSEPRWRTFRPFAVNCATADRKLIQEALESIDERDWQALDWALRQVPTPYQPGLYDVSLPDDLLYGPEGSPAAEHGAGDRVGV
jgi:hypothetical protein